MFHSYRPEVDSSYIVAFYAQKAFFSEKIEEQTRENLATTHNLYISLIAKDDAEHYTSLFLTLLQSTNRKRVHRALVDSCLNVYEYKPMEGTSLSVGLAELHMIPSRSYHILEERLDKLFFLTKKKEIDMLRRILRQRNCI